MEGSDYGLIWGSVLVATYTTAWHHKSEFHNQNFHLCENPKYQS